RRSILIEMVQVIGRLGLPRPELVAAVQRFRQYLNGLVTLLDFNDLALVQAHVATIVWKLFASPEPLFQAIQLAEGVIQRIGRDSTRSSRVRTGYAWEFQSAAAQELQVWLLAEMVKRIPHERLRGQMDHMALLALLPPDEIAIRRTWALSVKTI